MIWFVHDCVVVTEGEDDNGSNDDAGNNNDEKDSDNDDNCHFDGDDAFSPDCFFAAILDLPFLTIFVGIVAYADKRTGWIRYDLLDWWWHIYEYF